MRVPDPCEVLAGAVATAKQTDDLVHLDLEVAEALLNELAAERRPLSGPESHVIEEALGHAWDELAGAELNALTQITTAFAVTRHKLAAIRSALDLVGAGEIE